MNVIKKEDENYSFGSKVSVSMSTPVEWGWELAVGTWVRPDHILEPLSPNILDISALTFAYRKWLWGEPGLCLWGN